MSGCMAIRLAGFSNAYSCSLPPGHAGDHNDQHSGSHWGDETMPAASTIATTWADPDRDERRRPGCNCFMWDEDCPEHAKNGGGE
jgi:hypothetical protein